MTEWCECDWAEWDTLRDDQVSNTEPLRCETCNGIIHCEVCIEDTPATCTHIDYIVCRRHHSTAVNNVHSRTGC